jgi:uncharacterized protein YkwD
MGTLPKHWFLCLFSLGLLADCAPTDDPARTANGVPVTMIGASGAQGVAGTASSAPIGTGVAGVAAAGVVATAGTSGIGTGIAGSGAAAVGSAGRGGSARAGNGGSGAVPPRTGGAAGFPASGAAGAPPIPVVTDPSACPAPPADATPESVAALNAVNNLRVPAGSGCATLNAVIAQAAAAHCSYYITNNTANAMCTSNPHLEVMGCTGFTGMAPWDRMKTAGFVGNGGGGEVMAFLNSPEQAVATWANSIWHRTPILDPATTVLGYGKGATCDTMDFGPGIRTPTTTVVVYPYDGQTNLPTTFNGMYESPTPPAPATGWPGSSPITVYAQKAMLTEHVLTIDGSADPIEHVWLDATSPGLSAGDQQQLRNLVFMYANKPFAANTKYRVKVSGMYAGGMLAKEWTFTTGAVNRR